MLNESAPLLGRKDGGGDEAPVEVKPVESLRFYWPCLFFGVLCNGLAVGFSVWLTKSILDDPTRAEFYQHNWYIVWLVGFVMIISAWPAGREERRRHARDDSRTVTLPHRAPRASTPPRARRAAYRPGARPDARRSGASRSARVGAARVLLTLNSRAFLRRTQRFCRCSASPRWRWPS